MRATIYSAADNSPIKLHELSGVTVLCTVPAAFSGTCTSACVPAIMENVQRIKGAGADRIIVTSTDQPFAINEWKRSARWENSAIEFASDFGAFELRAIIGKLSDEEGKKNLPPLLGELLRRSYSVLKGDAVVWQFVEPDTTKFTLDVEELVRAVEAARR
ncbi:MAG TPA: redoxin family protein [Candidatus Peribacterales bacterium]|nr:redoxin family protein [Candidatus Peribacterales bacterium]